MPQLAIEAKIDALEKTLKRLAGAQGFVIIYCNHDCHANGSAYWKDGSLCGYCGGLGWNLVKDVVRGTR